MPHRASHALLTAPQLGQLLKSSRKRARLTQADVAGRLDLSQNRVSYLESHPDDISVRQLLAWCAAIGLELGLGERHADAPASASEW